MNEACRWWRKAAEQGNTQSQFNLGLSYRDGEGVTQNYDEAYRWLRKAAEQGLAAAQNGLGECYEEGYGVKKDENEALKWYRKAAEQGDENALYSLGSCYMLGHGVPVDYSIAAQWFHKAAMKGHEGAEYMEGYCNVHVKNEEIISRLRTAAKATPSTTSPNTSFSNTKKTITVKGVKFTMVPVEGGTFTMGGTGRENYEAEPAHSVTLTSFMIGETEVTQALWKAVMGSNPSDIRGDNKPVNNVSWDECQEFIRKLNAITGQHFRLPTEAEWEFAGRGGNKTGKFEYVGGNDPKKCAWYCENSGGTLHAVKTKMPNELGLYEMTGNVRNWCNDFYGPYSSEPQTDPKGPERSTWRVVRGCAFMDGIRMLDAGYRWSFSPDTKDCYIGLRLAL